MLILLHGRHDRWFFLPDRGWRFLTDLVQGRSRGLFVEDNLVRRGGRGIAMAEQVLLNGRHARLATGHLSGEPFSQRLELPRRYVATLVKPEEQPACLIGRGVTKLDLAIHPPGRISAGSSRSGWLVVRNKTRPSRELTPSRALSRPLKVTPVCSVVIRSVLNTQSTSSISSKVAGGKASTRPRSASSDKRRLLKLSTATDRFSSPAAARTSVVLPFPGGPCSR